MIDGTHSASYSVDTGLDLHHLEQFVITDISPIWR